MNHMDSSSTSITIIIVIALFLAALIQTHQSEPHITETKNGEIIHAYTFPNESQLFASQLWLNLTNTASSSSNHDVTITIHLNSTNTTMIQVPHQQPLEFEEFDPQVHTQTIIPWRVPVSGCLRMRQDTCALTHIEAQELTLLVPSGIKTGINVLIFTFGFDFGLNALGGSTGTSDIVVCRSEVDEIIQIQKNVRVVSFPDARARRIVWDDRAGGFLVSGAWERLVTFRMSPGLGLFFFNLNEIKHVKPICESRSEFLRCQVLR
ncbi:uncharacterized protein LODBEIA_P06500 [Lodderomyces beijingensis]|uniref:Ubiquitin 3 binding protein But2 C-terminal domain-containing protein n=1 Tax=Lodderomyces beijingensis TaxID=1775926 RepID=A0ABP0ZH16_9ASCO